ncbi:MAG: hypothetical protein AAFZ63_04760 [Bacteroidota bacterium]
MSTRPIVHYLFLVSAVLFPLVSSAQLRLSAEEATEDLHCLQRALEYVHPRLYKYTSKDSLDRRFTNAHQQCSAGISGLDFLASVRGINAAVNCGHLYTIPQAELREEVVLKKVMPFRVKVIEDRLYLVYNCADERSIPNGSEILSINGYRANDILHTLQAAIATDGYIQTRKNRLIERSYSSTSYGFDHYFHLHISRSDTFVVEALTPQSGQPIKHSLVSIEREERRQRQMDRYGFDENA